MEGACNLQSCSQPFPSCSTENMCRYRVATVTSPKVQTTSSCLHACPKLLNAMSHRHNTIGDSKAPLWKPTHGTDLHVTCFTRPECPHSTSVSPSVVFRQSLHGGLLAVHAILERSRVRPSRSLSASPTVPQSVGGCHFFAISVMRVTSNAP